MDIGVIKNWPCLHHSALYFGEISMCLCHTVSGNIRYVKKCFKTQDKTKGKTIENGFVY